MCTPIKLAATIYEILLRVPLNSINLTLLCFIIYRYVVKIWSFIVVKKIIVIWLSIFYQKKKWDWYSLVTNIHFLKSVKCFKCTLSHLFLFLFLIYNIEFKQWVSDCCFTQTQQFLKLYHGENNLIFNEMMMRFTLH